MRTSTLFSIFTLAIASFTLSVNGAPIPTEQQEQDFEIGLEKRMVSPKITYYSGSQLKNPACGGPNPKPWEMIAAVKSGGAFSCGDKIHIKNGENVIKVKVVDYCESCSTRSIDLSPGAFQKLASLDEGIIRGAKIWVS